MYTTEQTICVLRIKPAMYHHRRGRIRETACKNGSAMGTFWLVNVHFSTDTSYLSQDLAIFTLRLDSSLHCLHIPAAHCHLFFPIPTRPLLSLCSHKSFPCALLHTRLVRSNYGRAVQPSAHTLSTHSPHSLSLYQLGIKPVKQRAS